MTGLKTVLRPGGRLDIIAGVLGVSVVLLDLIGVLSVSLWAYGAAVLAGLLVVIYQNL